MCDECYNIYPNCPVCAPLSEYDDEDSADWNLPLDIQFIDLFMDESPVFESVVITGAKIGETWLNDRQIEELNDDRELVTVLINRILNEKQCSGKN